MDEMVSEMVSAMVLGRVPAYGHKATREDWETAARAAEVILRAQGKWETERAAN